MALAREHRLARERETEWRDEVHGEDVLEHPGLVLAPPIGLGEPGIVDEHVDAVEGSRQRRDRMLVAQLALAVRETRGGRWRTRRPTLAYR